MAPLLIPNRKPFVALSQVIVTPSPEIKLVFKVVVVLLVVAVHPLPLLVCILSTDIETKVLSGVITSYSDSGTGDETRI